MGRVEDDYTRPLKEIYESLPEDTREALSADIRKIWMYFIFWAVFIAISAVAIVWFVACELIDEPLGERLQRIGSIVPVLAVIGETLFIVRLNKLASVIHPAKLTYEIYKQRRFKPLVNISLWVTFLIVCLSAVFSGYGDLLF
ncbi:MAG: hypothetical protein A2061_08565 [Gallionellales bacterium GWA2_59_43]|nr:MAG: hypothetical protein A2061_08565 [Gallionellales bacterium GWA2_59_43]